MKDDSGPGCGTGTTAPVGSRPLGATPEGLMDMAGNAMEFVLDWYSTTYDQESPYENPQGPAAGQWRVMRSSGYGTARNTATRTWKRWAATLEACSDCGLRCAKPG